LIRDSDLDVRTELNNMRRASSLSALWVFVLLSMLFRDIHELANPEFVEQMLSQTVPESLLLVAGIILALPILMVPLNHLLLPVWSRRANLLVVLILAVAIITNPPGDLDDYWFTALELVGLGVIAWLAWIRRPEVAQPTSE
jgi:hypothetical protein